MVKCLPEFEYFYCVLENKNIIFIIRRSKVTDYVALTLTKCMFWSSTKIFEASQTNSVDPDQTAPVGAV